MPVRYEGSEEDRKRFREKYGVDPDVPLEDLPWEGLTEEGRQEVAKRFAQDWKNNEPGMRENINRSRGCCVFALFRIFSRRG